MIEEKNYNKKDDGSKREEIKTLMNRIEPYWDNKTKGVKESAPDAIKKDLKRLMKLLNEMSEKV